MKKRIQNKIIITDGCFNSIDIKKLKKKNEIERTAILIHCISCKCNKFLIIPNYVIENAKSLAKIFIPKNILCMHSLVAYVDKNFDVRSCEIADYELSVESIYDFPKD